MNTVALGAQGEELACRYLRRQGMTVVRRNWRCPFGEVDIIARDGDTVVIVEVKTRSGPGFGHPFEAITGSKVARLRRLAATWAHEHDIRPGAVRVDAVAVTLVPEQPAVYEHLQGIG